MFDPGQVGQFFAAWISYLWFGFEFGKFFNFFDFGSKKISSGWVEKYPGQRQVGHLITAGQK